MATHCEGAGKDDLKTQFTTREGTYKVLSLSEYSRPNRVGYNSQSNSPVKVSFVSLPDSSEERICFNVGRELYVYMYRGVKKAADLSKPVDKRVYKGTYPTCHDFHPTATSEGGLLLLVGFSAGQVQLIDPVKKELSRLYNDERLIDKSRVTCVRWLPNSSSLFLVSHASGQLYVYKEDLPCGSTPPHYQLFKQGDGFSVFTCKTKSTRNPLYRWVVGEGALHEFAFSPCARYLATASQDGFLRVFCYDTMDLVGLVRSYFGGLLCVCWSPDGRYVVAGGEDDLVTVWSFQDKRVVARGQGHRSWVQGVAFDACLEGGHASGDCPDTSYRFGSVGQDTQLCLWDLTEDVLKQPRARTSLLIGSSPGTTGSDARKRAAGARNRLVGTPACPRLDEVPMLEPHICKKVAPERLTALVFREDCLVTACQEGYVCTWARPGRASTVV
uniref:Putative wd40 protein dmr-n9 n=1 Tax=Ixodes ricinus TaxID=34613 RepID=V5HSI7_IXORI